MINESEFESTVIARIKGEAEATDAEKKGVGGEKTLTIINELFQTDEEAQEMAEILLARQKGRKQYCKASSDFCPVPLERNDTIQIQERITKLENLSWPYYGDSNYKFGNLNRKFRSDGVVLAHLGIIRNIKFDVTQTTQVLTVVIEEE